jgi:hypothetical protein
MQDGSKNGNSGGAGCAARTVIDGGSELLIFVAPRASERGLVICHSLLTDGASFNYSKNLQLTGI